MLRKQAFVYDLKMIKDGSLCKIVSLHIALYCKRSITYDIKHSNITVRFSFFFYVFVQRDSSGNHIPINEIGKSKVVVLLGQVVSFRSVNVSLLSFTKAWRENVRVLGNV